MYVCVGFQQAAIFQIPTQTTFMTETEKTLFHEKKSSPYATYSNKAKIINIFAKKSLCFFKLFFWHTEHNTNKSDREEAEEEQELSFNLPTR